MKFLTNKIQNLIWYKNFINNNKKLFPLDYDKKKNKKSEILVEFNAFKIHISLYHIYQMSFLDSVNCKVLKYDLNYYHVI